MGPRSPDGRGEDRYVSEALARRVRNASHELRAPRVVALERLVEVEHVGELVARIGGLAHEQLESRDQREQLRRADVGRNPEIPQLEHESARARRIARAP